MNSVAPLLSHFWNTDLCIPALVTRKASFDFYTDRCESKKEKFTSLRKEFRRYFMITTWKFSILHVYSYVIPWLCSYLQRSIESIAFRVMNRYISVFPGFASLVFANTNVWKTYFGSLVSRKMHRCLYVDSVVQIHIFKQSVCKHWCQIPHDIHNNIEFDSTKQVQSYLEQKFHLGFILRECLILLFFFFSSFLFGKEFDKSIGDWSCTAIKFKRHATTI